MNDDSESRLAQEKFNRCLLLLEELHDIVFHVINMGLDAGLTPTELIRQSVDALLNVDNMSPDDLIKMREDFDKMAAQTVLVSPAPEPEVEQPLPETVIGSGESSTTGFVPSNAKKKDWLH